MLAKNKENEWQDFIISLILLSLSLNMSTIKGARTVYHCYKMVWVTSGFDAKPKYRDSTNNEFKKKTWKYPYPPHIPYILFPRFELFRSFIEPSLSSHSMIFTFLPFSTFPHHLTCHNDFISVHQEFPADPTSQVNGLRSTPAQLQHTAIRILSLK